MNLWQVIILGAVQGATEFIPVSSSGHLILIREFLGWSDVGMSFDIILHLATLLALLIYFRKKILKLVVDLSKGTKSAWHLFWGLVIATLPAVVLGYLFEDLVARYFRSGYLVGILMIILAAVFIFTEKESARCNFAKRKEVLSFLDYFLIGLAQGVALLPGVSRSGATIAAGMNRKMARVEAAEFSFLLAIPAICGAVFYDLIKNGQNLKFNFFSAFIGFLVAFVVGYFSIIFLIRYLSRRSLHPFAYYLFFVGAIAIIASLWP